MIGLVDELSDFLDSINVKHGKLVLLEKNNNHAYSDLSHVFVKVTVLSNSSALRSEVGFLRAHSSQVPSVSLVHDDVVPVQGGKRFAVFYRFEKLDPLTYDMLKADPLLLDGLVDRVKEFNSLTVNGDSLRSFGLDTVSEKASLRVAHFRASQHSGGSLESYVSRYLDLMERFKSSDWGEFISSELSSDAVLCHGDCHLGNFALREGTPILVDYESVIAAPVEYDMVSMIFILKHYRGDNDLYQRFVSRFDMLKSPEFLQGMLFLRLLSSSGYLLLGSEDDRNSELFMRRVDDLEVCFDARELIRYSHHHSVNV